ncbi:GntR family transcriptional regulator [Alkalihalobacillus sp. BA299]|uniref:GntR family transcriptional regulator n=1 Tax=Alkalihalobacillus sp. BA299 TaxID=2815938 RepID=UPI001ADA508B|nr:GntR family transcriptional regulator [Alkalihalobacillus sp. BA299]
MKRSQEMSLRHLEIAEYLIGKICSGQYAVNEKIPSENELCRQFNVNRNTVRLAVGRLTNLGWVTPIHGKGCYVNQIPEPIVYVLSSKTRFSENMKKQGLAHSSQLIDWHKANATEGEQKSLGLVDTDLVYRLEILRCIDQKPVSITTTIIPEQEVPLFEEHLTNFQSLYQILIEHYQIHPVRAKSSFQASLASLKDAELLDLPENVPILQIESMMNHPAGTPLEYSVARIRGDMHKCLVEF